MIQTECPKCHRFSISTTDLRHTKCNCGYGDRHIGLKVVTGLFIGFIGILVAAIVLIKP